MHRFDFEVDADRADKRRGEGVVSVTEQKTSFSHTAVANDEQLEHVVKILIGYILLHLRLLTGIIGRRHLEGWRESGNVRQTSYNIVTFTTEVSNKGCQTEDSHLHMLGSEDAMALLSI